MSECNRLASEELSNEKTRWLRSRLGQLEMDHALGIVNEEAYTKEAASILDDLDTLETQSRNESEV